MIKRAKENDWSRPTPEEIEAGNLRAEALLDRFKKLGYVVSWERWGMFKHYSFHLTEEHVEKILDVLESSS